KKTVNGEEQLQALVDRKKVIITEATIIRDLQLEDAKGVDYLPNAEIFKQLTLMWFVQVFLDKQVDGMSKHNAIYVIPSHTKKVFGNMKRVGKGFSGRETPLFPTMIVQAQEDMGEGSAHPTNLHHTPTITQPSTSKLQKKQKPRKPKRQDIEETQPSGPTTNVEDEAFNEENVSKHSNDPLHSGEDRIKLKELMEICTKLQNRVFDLENTKTAQAQEIDSLKRRVKKLERRQKSKNYGLERLYKVGLSAIVKSSDEESLSEENAFKQERNIAVIDADKEITLVDETVEELGRFDDQEMFDTWVLDDEEVVVKKTVANKEVSGIKEVNAASIATFVIATTTTAATTPTISMDEITLAKALIEIKTSRPNAKGIVMQDPSKTSTPTLIVSSQQPSKVQDKGKGIIVEPEMPLKKKAQINEEVNLAWDDIQAKVDADYELAQRLQAEEQEQLRDAEKPRLFMEFLKKRKKLFAAGKAEEKRNRPPTQAQQRSLMLQESSSKRARDELEQEKSKKQKVEDDKEQKELKKCLEIIPDDGYDVTIDAISLSSKPPTIVYYKIYKEGRKSYFQIFRVDGNSQMYLIFSKMLTNFDREDLEVLWRLVKTRLDSQWITWIVS
nr:hypothetical protein [Tanacetum cinerariifolium]